MSFTSALSWAESFSQNKHRTKTRSRVARVQASFTSSNALEQLLNKDPSDPMAMASVLTRHQKILPRRISRLPRRDHRQFARHVKRLRHLLILNTQSTPVSAAKLYPSKNLSPLRTKKRPYDGIQNQKRRIRSFG